MEIWNRRNPVGGAPIVDSALDVNSEHCVQNKVVAEAISTINSNLSTKVVTKSSDNTIVLVASGNVCQLVFLGKSVSQATAWTNFSDISIPQGYRPPYNIHESTMDGESIRISGGVVSYRGTSTALFGTITYIANPAL